MDHASSTSSDLFSEHFEQLRAIFPQFVKDGEIDFDSLQAFLKKDGMLAGPEKYGLSWAGKSNAFNLIRRPASGTLTPNLKESKHWDTTQNLFIEGDNLEVLKLLQKHYRNSIKMIYIDPPYNTGKDFIYSDNFTESVSDYYERTGQSAGGVKLTSNPESNGRYHSDWLTMMYPRLFLGRNLLRDDGVIFVSIDDNEVHNLRLIMDEIFGEENFISSIVWQKKYTQSNDSKFFSYTHEYLICYGKNLLTDINLIGRFERTDEQNNRYTNPDNEERGPWKAIPLHARSGSSTESIVFENGVSWTPPKGTFHRLSKETLKKYYLEKRIYFGKNGNSIPVFKKFLSEVGDIIPDTIWLHEEVGSTGSARQDLKNLMEQNIFDTPKPTNLIKRLVQLTSSDSKTDIILDFFAGSGTTAHAVMDLNAEDGGKRRWISVQLPELTDDASEAKKAGFNTIADISRERIRRAGEKIGKGDIGFKAFTLSPSNYRRWRDIPAEDTDALMAQTNLFNQKPLVDGYNEQTVVYELLVKEGFNLNATVTQQKLDGLDVWQVVDGERRMIISFASNLTKEQIEALRLGEHHMFVCFDSALDDTTKVNVGRSLKIKVM